jgi:hypothetical protein
MLSVSVCCIGVVILLEKCGQGIWKFVLYDVAGGSRNWIKLAENTIL